MSAKLSRVSILVTTYNLGEHFGRCVSGLVTQSSDLSAVEIVIADDGSDDHSLTYAADLERIFGSVKLLRRQHAGFRLASLKNMAIEAAEGDYLAFLDGDMIAPREWLLSHLRVIVAEPECAVSIGPRRFVDATSISPRELRERPDAAVALGGVRSASNWRRVKDRRLPELARLESHPAPFHLFHGCNAVVPRRLAIEVAGFDEAFDGHWGYEDTEFAYRLWMAGARFNFSPSTVAFHQENQIISFSKRRADDLINFELACARIPEFRAFKDRLRAAGRRPWW